MPPMRASDSFLTFRLVPVDPSSRREAIVPAMTNLHVKEDALCKAM